MNDLEPACHTVLFKQDDKATKKIRNINYLCIGVPQVNHFLFGIVLIDSHCY